jgi:hypothetical protein
MIFINTATAGSDETLRIWYFFGPSSTREKDIYRFLKPLMPPYFSMLPFNKRRNQNNSSYTHKIFKGNSSLFRKDEIYSIHDNSFGCIIR